VGKLIRAAGLFALAFLAAALPPRPAPAATMTTLYDFCAQPNCADRSAPEAAVIADADGNPYGVTSSGGTFGNGTVFTLTHNRAKTQWTEKVLYNFCITCGGPVHPSAVS
jgi:hypothetical protein